jgi:hypothetical protein
MGEQRPRQDHRASNWSVLKEEVPHSPPAMPMASPSTSPVTMNRAHCLLYSTYTSSALAASKFDVLSPSCLLHALRHQVPGQTHFSQQEWDDGVNKPLSKDVE